MNFDESYMQVARDVVSELMRYTGEVYAGPFLHDAVALSRLAVAIQRAVEHKEAHGCKHEEICKE
jgi:hypothetical protein